MCNVPAGEQKRASMRRRPGKAPLPAVLTGLKAHQTRVARSMEACVMAPKAVSPVVSPATSIASGSSIEASDSSDRSSNYSWGASEILPESLYLGSAGDALNASAIEANGITHIVNATRDCGNSCPEGTRILRVPVDDCCDAPLHQHFLEASDFIHSARLAGGRVLVHCKGGVSRSSALCVAYIMMLFQYTSDSALEYVMARRSIASPNIGFLLSLETFGTTRAAQQWRHGQQKRGGGGAPAALGVPPTPTSRMPRRACSVQALMDQGALSAAISISPFGGLAASLNTPMQNTDLLDSTQEADSEEEGAAPSQSAFLPEALPVC